MRAALFSALLLGSVTPCVADIPAKSTDVFIDPASSGKRFDGIGATSTGIIRLLIDYPPRQRAEILDYLFAPKYAASLQQLKVEIGGDGNSNAGSEPSSMHTAADQNYARGVGWWLMKQARQRNPNIVLSALAWNFPGWVKQGHSEQTVDYLTRYLEGARQAQGLDIDYIGIWNETYMDPAFIIALRRSLDQHHLKTQIVADDLVNTWNIVKSMDENAELRQAVAAIGTHYPRFESPEFVQRKSLEWGKPIWSTEDGPWADDWGAHGQQSRAYAEVLNRNYVQGRLTSTNLWALVSAAPDTFGLPHAGLLVADSPWSGHYTLKSPLWVVAHTTQFAQPGWRYSDRASGLLPNGGSYVTLHDGNDYSLIVETLAAQTTQTIQIRLSKDMSRAAVHVWRTTEQNWFQRVGEVEPRTGAFSYSFEPNSVYTLSTTTGQTEAKRPTPPPEQDFPVPYHEEFESNSSGDTTPRFLLEQNGSYEVAACGFGRNGKCLRQLVDQAPVPWTYWGDSTATGAPDLFGDKRWRDYRVAVDALLEQPGYVMLVGRVARADCDGTLDGYQFRLYDTGRWELHTNIKNALVASGRASGGLNRWRHLALTFRGTRISGAIDGAQVFSLQDASHPVGMAGFGTGWNRGRFDSLALDPVASNVPVISAPPVPEVVAPPVSAPELLVPVTAEHAVRLSWKPVPTATAYRVRIGTQPDQFDKTEEAGSALTYNFKTLTNGVKYFFEVAGTNSKGEGKWSSAQSAVPGEQ